VGDAEIQIRRGFPGWDGQREQQDQETQTMQMANDKVTATSSSFEVASVFAPVLSSVSSRISPIQTFRAGHPANRSRRAAARPAMTRASSLPGACWQAAARPAAGRGAYR